MFACSTTQLRKCTADVATWSYAYKINREAIATFLVFVLNQSWLLRVSHYHIWKINTLENLPLYGVHVQSYMYIPYIYIAGNFRMVQNFAFFADRSAAAKIRTVKFWMGNKIVTSYHTCMYTVRIWHGPWVRFLIVIPWVFFCFSWFANVDGMKDLYMWCSSMVWLLSVRTYEWLLRPQWHPY